MHGGAVGSGKSTVPQANLAEGLAEMKVALTSAWHCLCMGLGCRDGSAFFSYCAREPKHVLKPTPPK